MNPKLIADGRTQVMGAIVIALLSSLWANLANAEKTDALAATGAVSIHQCH